MRTVFAREDVVRLGPKRPPIAATATFVDGVVTIDGVVAGDPRPFTAPIAWPYAITEHGTWASTARRPADGERLRAVGLAERAVLVEGALDRGRRRPRRTRHDARARAVLLDTCVPAPSGALAGARVHVDDRDRSIASGARRRR